MQRRRPVPTPLLALLLLFLVPACGREGESGPERAASTADLAEVRARDTLTVVTTFNSTSYFLYRGEPMGFEYELLREFAEDLGVKLNAVVVRDRDSIPELLRAGVGDVGAARLAPGEYAGEGLAFTQPLYETQPTLVQRGAPPAAGGVPTAVDTLLQAARTGGTVPVRARLVTAPGQLAGKRVHLPADSRYAERLMEISDSITGDIHVVEAEPGTRTEALVRAVARGRVGLAVASENLADLTASYYGNLVLRPTLGPPHPVALAVREGSPELRAALDAWLADEKNAKQVRALYRKYFVDREGYRERVESEYLTSETSRLSEYDPLFRRAASELGWDWRLLASQAFQESRFDPDARSWAGAEGLLQLMPRTARAVGVSNSRDPEQNVTGAVRFLRDLREHWTPKIPDPAERLKFILAAYNTGTGHVEDAQRLTEKNGGDPQSWEDVSKWLLQKSKREVYTDPVVKHGFSRGLEPVLYVARVLERFEHYRQFVTPGE
ncbi:MAG TPA: transporter substrate-binding domain-containing protein [Longimicrobiaceae bacterium]|nr:transporter substrate-binding domain-containing protein [Longimicrobiaceae bacterium]